MSDLERPGNVQDITTAAVKRAAEGRDFHGLDELVRTHGRRAGRRVALTFDDGPVLRTQEVASVLRKQGARATFFVVGMNVPGHEGLVRRLVAEGHEVGNHSFTHPPFPSEADIAAASAVIASVVGRSPAVFRPPFGAVDRAGALAARRLGMEVVLWDVDSRDAVPAWVGARAEEVHANVMHEVRGGSIVLMHDGSPWSSVAEALPGLIAGLHDRGCELVTVSELLGGDDRRPLVPRLGAGRGRGARSVPSLADPGQGPGL